MTPTSNFYKLNTDIFIFYKKYLSDSNVAHKDAIYFMKTVDEKQNISNNKKKESLYRTQLE